MDSIQTCMLIFFFVIKPNLRRKQMMSLRQLFQARQREYLMKKRHLLKTSTLSSCWPESNLTGFFPALSFVWCRIVGELKWASKQYCINVLVVQTYDFSVSLSFTPPISHFFRLSSSPLPSLSQQQSSLGLWFWWWVHEWTFGHETERRGIVPGQWKL